MTTKSKEGELHLVFGGGMAHLIWSQRACANSVVQSIANAEAYSVKSTMLRRCCRGEYTRLLEAARPSWSHGYVFKQTKAFNKLLEGTSNGLR
jgi:hypothetical protein